MDEEAREAENRTGKEEACSTENKQDRGTDTEVSRLLSFPDIILEKSLFVKHAHIFFHLTGRGF